VREEGCLLVGRHPSGIGGVSFKVTWAGPLFVYIMACTSDDRRDGGVDMG